MSLTQVITERRVKKIKDDLAYFYELTVEDLAELFQVPPKVIEEDLKREHIELNKGRNQSFDLYREKRKLYEWVGKNTDPYNRADEEISLSKVGLWTAPVSFGPNKGNSSAEENIQHGIELAEYGYTRAFIKEHLKLKEQDMQAVAAGVIQGFKDVDFGAGRLTEFAERHIGRDENEDIIKAAGVSKTYLDPDPQKREKYRKQKEEKRAEKRLKAENNLHEDFLLYKEYVQKYHMARIHSPLVRDFAKSLDKNNTTLMRHFRNLWTIAVWYMEQPGRMKKKYSERIISDIEEAIGLGLARDYVPRVEQEEKIKKAVEEAVPKNPKVHENIVEVVYKKEKKKKFQDWAKENGYKFANDHVKGICFNNKNLFRAYLDYCGLKISDISVDHVAAGSPDRYSNAAPRAFINFNADIDGITDIKDFQRNIFNQSLCIPFSYTVTFSGKDIIISDIDFSSTLKYFPVDPEVLDYTGITDRIAELLKEGIEKNKYNFTKNCKAGESFNHNGITVVSHMEKDKTPEKKPATRVISADMVAKHYYKKREEWFDKHMDEISKLCVKESKERPEYYKHHNMIQMLPTVALTEWLKVVSNNVFTGIKFVGLDAIDRNLVVKLQFINQLNDWVLNGTRCVDNIAIPFDYQVEFKKTIDSTGKSVVTPEISNVVVIKHGLNIPNEFLKENHFMRELKKSVMEYYKDHPDIFLESEEETDLEEGKDI